MPPEAKAKAGAGAKAKAKAKAAARPENALQRTIREAVAAGHEPTLGRKKESLFIQKAGGGRLILERAGRLRSRKGGRELRRALKAIRRCLGHGALEEGIPGGELGVAPGEARWWPCSR